MTDEVKPDLILQDGREITFDLSAVTWQEYMGIFNQAESEERSDKTLAKACGLDYKKEYVKLSVLDCKRIVKAFVKKAQDPLADPN